MRETASLKSIIGRSHLKANSEMDETTIHSQTAHPELPAFPQDAGAEQPQAWKMIENGRYQPQRIKGSCLGRELG
jgi:hypothetical protein